VLLENGTALVVGFDFDQGALEKAHARAAAHNLTFLPLFFDAANPSPDQGWAQNERGGLASRANADAMIALAFIHHLAIARNIPLHDLIEWLVKIAPTGVIEFIPKSDPMVKELLRLREDIFPDYNESNFQKSIESFAKVIKKKVVSKSGRTLYWYSCS
jgi:ribosomal protein L11 methylase PrmA